MQPEHRSHPGAAPGLELPQPSSLLDPAEHLLDPLPGIDRAGIARMADSAAINRRKAMGLDVVGHMGRDPIDP